jgi:hypothetical protein
VKDKSPVLRLLSLRWLKSFFRVPAGFEATDMADRDATPVVIPARLKRLSLRPSPGFMRSVHQRYLALVVSLCRVYFSHGLCRVGE